jgi:hypothetical protein
MFFFVYKTKHKNGKFYIGRHQTSILEDGYLGSGKWVLSIKNETHLEREIIYFASTLEEMCEMEEYYINLHFDDPLCMNYKRSSIGWCSADVSEQNRKLDANGKSKSQNRAKRAYENKTNPIYYRNTNLKREDNPFTKREDGTSVALDRVKNGGHNLVGGVTCVDTSGNICQLPKEVYRSQTGDKNTWEYVCVASNVGKIRLNIKQNKVQCINVFGETKYFLPETYKNFDTQYWVDITSEEGKHRENHPMDVELRSQYVAELGKTAMLKKYGVDNAFKLPDHKEKIAKTNVEKYGEDHYSKSTGARDKIKLVRQNDPVLICEICGIEIKGKGNYKSHMNKHKGDYEKS